MAAVAQRHKIEIIIRAHTYPFGHSPTPQEDLSDDRVHFGDMSKISTDSTKMPNSVSQIIILVTHFVTIAAMTGNGVSSGEGILMELHEDTFYTVVGQLDFGIER